MYSRTSLCMWHPSSAWERDSPNSAGAGKQVLCRAASAGGRGCQTAIAYLGVNRRGSLLAKAGELWEKDVRLPGTAASRSWEPGPGLN